VIDGVYHLVKWFGDAAELYDVVNDSMETRNLANESSMAAVFQRLQLLGDSLRRPVSPGDSMPVAPTRERGVVDVDNNTPRGARR
jgi:hypothetical protein